MIRRVLIVQPYGIGDLLFITPVLRALRLLPSVKKVDLLIGSRTRAVIQSNPHVDNIFVIDKDQVHANTAHKNFQFARELVKTLRQNRYDLMLDYSMRGEYAFWGRWILGIKKRAGYAYKNRAAFHNIRVAIPDGFQEKHAVDYACDLAQAAGVRVKNRFVEFFFSENQADALQKVLTPKLPQDYIALSLGGGESWGKDAHLKRWSVQNFSEFARYLLKKSGVKKVVLVGSAGESDLARQFLQTGIDAEDWTGKLSIPETAWVIKNSRFFVGNDGGLLHLARAVFKPAIGIYGPADPVVYGPYPQGVLSAAVYEPPADGRPRYFRFRYDPRDESLKKLTVSSAIKILESRNISFLA